MTDLLSGSGISLLPKAVNQMHGFLLEFGISLPQGLVVMKRLSDVLAEHELPVRLTMLLQRLHDHFVYLDEQVKGLDKELAGQLADDDLGCRLLSMPCVGPISASLSMRRQQNLPERLTMTVVLTARQSQVWGWL